jgi:hypothetical protein
MCIISPVPNISHLLSGHLTYSKAASPILSGSNLTCPLLPVLKSSHMFPAFSSVLKSSYLNCSHACSPVPQIIFPIPNPSPPVLKSLFPTQHTYSKIIPRVPKFSHLFREKNTPACLNKICSKSLLLGTFSYHLPLHPFPPTSWPPVPPRQRFTPLEYLQRVGGGGVGWRRQRTFDAVYLRSPLYYLQTNPLCSPTRGLYSNTTPLKDAILFFT